MHDLIKLSLNVMTDPSPIASMLFSEIHFLDSNRPPVCLRQDFILTLIETIAKKVVVDREINTCLCSNNRLGRKSEMQQLH